MDLFERRYQLWSTLIEKGRDRIKLVAFGSPMTNAKFNEKNASLSEDIRVAVQSIPFLFGSDVVAAARRLRQTIHELEDARHDYIAADRTDREATKLARDKFGDLRRSSFRSIQEINTLVGPYINLSNVSVRNNKKWLLLEGAAKFLKAARAKFAGQK